MIINRRSLITGLISFIAAPMIVRARNIMPVRMMIESPIAMKWRQAIVDEDSSIYLDGTLVEHTLIISQVRYTSSSHNFVETWVQVPA